MATVDDDELRPSHRKLSRRASSKDVNAIKNGTENTMAAVTGQFMTTPEDHEAVKLVSPLVLQRVVTVAVICNAIQLGLCVKSDSDEQDMACLISDNVFTVVFAVEMLLKLHAQTWHYFHSYLNILDFSLVCLGLADIIFVFALGSCDMCRDLSVLRLLKILRTFRLIRVLEARRELAVLAQGIVASLKAMVWVGILLGLLIYATAIFCVGMLSDEISMEIGFETSYFNNLSEAVITLFNIAILAEWGEIARPLWQSEHAWKIVFFFLYIFVASFGILNLLIGIITESTADAARIYEKRREDQAKQERMDGMHEVAEQVFRIDVDGNGRLNESEFEEVGNTEGFAELLNAMELPPDFKLRDLHLTISAERDIGKKDFIRSLKRLIFCDEFQRDCMQQREIHAVMRKLTDLEGMVEQILNVLTKKPEQFASSNGKTEAQQNCQDVRKVSQEPAPHNISMNEHTGKVSASHVSNDIESLRGDINALQYHLTIEIRNMKNEICSDMVSSWKDQRTGERSAHSTKVDTLHPLYSRGGHDKRSMVEEQTSVEIDPVDLHGKMALELEQIMMRINTDRSTVLPL